MISVDARFPSLPDKYNFLMGKTLAGAVLVWEDDDVYLPGYVAAQVACLRNHDLSRPGVVLSDYSGPIKAEPADGRFHSSLAFRRSLAYRLGGWPDTHRADFDQQFIKLLEVGAKSIGKPWPDEKPAHYVYSWHTGAMHGQSLMRSPDDENWYKRAAKRYPDPGRIGKLTPALDERTSDMIQTLLL